jgi:hypothetical protein
MKKKFLITCIFLVTMTFCINTNAQEKYGKTFNIGLGAGGYSGYYSFANRSLPVLHFDYEFDVAKNLTLAPFINLASYTEDYWWGNNSNPYRYYTYTETSIPIGVKGSYYFDDVLNASSKWDFYLSGSLGFVIINSSWNNNYQGNKDYYYRDRNPLFLDIHIGTEYHFNKRLGAFADLSTGVFTLGIAIHGNN